MRDFKEYTIFDAVTPQTLTSSTDATPIVVTKTAHGLSTGAQVLIFGHATNVAANGIRTITVLSSSTFSLQDPYTGANIVGSGAGAGSGGYVCTAPRIVLVEDHVNALISFITTGTATLTAKIAGSIGKVISDSNILAADDCPNFGATQSKSNPYTFLQAINQDDGSSVNGSTGFVASGTDLNTLHEVNINGVKYLTLLPTAWTAGAMTAKVQLFTRN